MRSTSSLLKVWFISAVLLLLTACSSRYQAPVDQAGDPLFLNAGRQHLVNQGETLYAVAWMYDLDFNAHARAKNLREPYTLTPGQYLSVDLRAQGGGRATTAAAPARAAASAVTVNPVNQGNAVSRAPLPGGNTRPARSALPAGDATAAATTNPAAPPATAPVTTPPVAAPPATDNRAAVAAAPAATTPPAATSSAPAAPNTGAVSWAWPHAGNIIGRFSDSGSDNKGIDIDGKAGDPVLAAADGEVVYAGSGLLHYGNLLIIKHNDRYLSAYAHNRALLVSEKAKVTKGQRIAELGSSGIDREMLHFEIRVDGKPSDPLQYLPSR